MLRSTSVSAYAVTRGLQQRHPDQHADQRGDQPGAQPDDAALGQRGEHDDQTRRPPARATPMTAPLVGLKACTGCGLAEERTDGHADRFCPRP